MKIRNMMVLLSVVVCSMLVLTGCPKKPEEAAMPEAQKPAVEAPAPAPAPAQEEVKPAPAERSAAEAAGLKPIYFDFDRSFIRDDAKTVMKENANWLKANPKVKVRIEGNCDERGTIEYNQALGQRRASAAKKYLTDMGISASRISLISYGKEKPACSNATEECWQQNRRDDIVSVE